MTYPNPPSPAKYQCALQLKGPAMAPRCLSLSYFFHAHIPVIFFAQQITFQPPRLPAYKSTIVKSGALLYMLSTVIWFIIEFEKIT